MSQIQENKYILNPGDNSKDWLTNLTYFFDALDPNDVEENGSVDAANALRNIAVEKIGARQKVITNNQLNVLFSLLYENYIYVVAGHGDSTKEQRKLAL